MSCRTAITEYVDNRLIGGYKPSEGFTVRDIVKRTWYADATVREILWDMVKKELLRRELVDQIYRYYPTDKWAA